MDAVSLSSQQTVYTGDSASFLQGHTPEKLTPRSDQESKKQKSLEDYSITPAPAKLSDGHAKPVSFDEVMNNFEKEHGHYEDTNWIARSYINRANEEIVKQNNGGWLLIELPFEAAMKVLLPGHTHDGENKTLLSDCGLTARDAAHNYKLWNEQDKEQNPLCSGSLNYHLNNPNKKPIFLTVEPINSKYDYGEIIDNPKLAEKRLIHLDGLHRLVALAITNNTEHSISAYVACKSVPKKVDGLGFISRDGIQHS